MKKYFLIAATLFICSGLFAKKVKFSVNMTGQVVVDSLGVHVTGDFQTAAGFAGGNWIPNTATMTQEVADTNIYSIIVDIPAFTKYEYKYVNGIFAYQVEFVPIESRVLYNYIDNRWIYIDSLANDTTIIEPVIFGTNAPIGKHLLRFEVDLQNEAAIDPTGIHVEGTFQGWNPAKTRMYSFDGHVYEYITYIDTLTAVLSNEFKYLNGNTIANAEVIPSPCVTANGNRETYLPKDSMLAVICYSGCVDCLSIGISENNFSEGIRISPNPTSEFAMLEFNDKTSLHTICILDVEGRIVRTYKNYYNSYLRIEKSDLNSGMYFINISGANKSSTLKLIFN